MKRLCFFALLITSFLFSNVSQAQIIADPTTWNFETKRINDKEYKLVINLKLKKDWHIWSLTPGGDGMQIPPSFVVEKNPDAKATGKAKEFGKKQTAEMDGVDGAVNFYENEVRYEIPLTVTANTTIKGKYEYQVCDHEMCLPPKRKTFSVTINDIASVSTDTATTTAAATVPDTTTVATAAAVTTPPPTNNVAATATTNTDTPPPTTSTEPKQDMSLWLLFFAALGFGLLAVTTPCVYSMIPITVSFFTKRSKTRKEGIRNAIYYSLSIIIIFTLLGVLISLAFGPQALYKLSTNWIANLFFFVLFIVFGISFLGAFEITLPSSWTNATDSKANTNSFKGIFFMALTLVIVSFSCTSGFIGPLLVGASKGGLLGPAIGMFGFSIGLALPFTIFSLAPTLINKMGSAGGWLNQVKVTLGFIELGLALKFFSNADLVKNWRILDREIFIAIWVVLAIMIGIYLLGKLKLSHDSAGKPNVHGQEYVSLFKLFLAMISFTFAVYLLPGMWGAPLKGLGQFLPPMGTQDFVIGTNNHEGNGTPQTTSGGPAQHTLKYAAQMAMYEPPVVKNNGLITYFDYEEAVAASKTQNKPLMLDFTGITCVNCRLMETNVWSNPEVIKILKNDFVLASLYCDASQVEIPESEHFDSKELDTKVTTLADKNLHLQISKFNSNSQPFYFFVDYDGNKLAAEGYGTDLNIAKFIAHLESVKKRYKELHP